VTLATSIPEYLVKLRELFDEVEEKEADLEEKTNLLRIFEIVKRFINEPDDQMLSMLISDEIMPMTLGALECNLLFYVDNPLTPQRRDFRSEFEQIRFNNILQLPEEIIEEYVTPVIRLDFLRDCVVATFIEPLAELKFNHV
jgi:hypothetical protein